MKIFPQDGWDREPFEAVLSLADGTRIKLFDVTVETIDARVMHAIRNYPADAAAIRRNAAEKS